MIISLTGYFSSKPAQKILSTMQDASLRAAEILFAGRCLPLASDACNVANEAHAEQKISRAGKHLLPVDPADPADPAGTRLSFAGPATQWWQAISDARYQSALYQHHDALPGTSFIDGCRFACRKLSSGTLTQRITL
jgi:hypothetical protein